MAYFQRPNTGYHSYELVVAVVVLEYLRRTPISLNKIMEKIKDLEKLLYTCLDAEEVMLDYSVKPLEINSENYGSIMLEIVVDTKKGTDTKSFNAVAKVRPESEYLRRVFPLEVCFKNEIAVYKYVLPCITQFAKERGFDRVEKLFPCCYVARSSLKDEDTVDDDVVLMLENLKLSGYVVVDRMEGFDLLRTTNILKDLATFHGVSLSLKLLKPETFRTHVLNKLARREKFDSLSKESEEKLMALAMKAADDEFLAQRAEKALRYYFNTYKQPVPPREPFATLIHNDFWITNVMIHYNNDKEMASKMIDFQRVEYGSPTRDLIFFLFTSVKLECLESHCERLIQFYYTTLIDVLRKFRCDVTQFSFEEFLEEIRVSAATKEFYHLILMTQYVHAKKNTKELDENYTERDHFSQMQITELCLARLKTIILHFAKNNWI